MKYKQEYLKLKEQLALETKEKERYESYWHTEKDITTYQEEKISKLDKEIKDLKTSKLNLEIDLLRKVVSLHEREPKKTIIDSGISGQFATPNGATTSSSTTII
jgi:hypothetical protein